MAKVKLACAGLGNKAPRPGHPRVKYCPLCQPNQVKISELHVLTDCVSVERVRRETGLSFEMNLLRLSGGDESEDAYYKYVNGLDKDGAAIDKSSYLQRGEAMGEVIAAWLSLW